MNIEIHGNVTINNNGGRDEGYDPQYIHELLAEDLDFLLDECDCDCESCADDTRQGTPIERIIETMAESNKILQEDKKNLIHDYAEILFDSGETMSEIVNILSDFLDDYMDCF